MSNLDGITDHAILRYLQRVKGFEIENIHNLPPKIISDVRAEMRSAGLDAAIAAGASRYKRGSISFIISEGVVKTVTLTGKSRRKGKEAPQRRGATRRKRKTNVKRGPQHG